MAFSNLETSLITAVFATVVGFVVKQRSVSRTDCRAQHESQDVKFRILFRMVRALVVNSDIPEQEKVKLLNDKGD